MGKLRQISVALALALMLCVTMLGTGAFAQSVAHNSARVIATNTLVPNAQSATTNVQQAENQRLCRWVPGHWMMTRFWVPGYWVWYPYRHWMPGHWVRSWRWMPGYWYPSWCGGWHGSRR